MAVEDTIAVEPVGEFALKGIRRPLAAYNVLAARAEQGCLMAPALEAEVITSKSGWRNDQALRQRVQPIRA
jgi:hypothetical protein